MAACKGLDNLLNFDCKDQDTLNLVKYLVPDDRVETVLENPQILKTPIVRNGKQATVGYCPEIWKTWQ